MQLAAAVHNAPPRTVPLSTKLVVLFGGPLGMIGWLLGGFGMIFAILFVGNADFASSFYFRGALESTQGTVIECVDTHASEGGSRHSHGTPIYAYHYTFFAIGNTYTNISYRTGRNLNEKHAVTVEFPTGHPEHSRIQGMRTAVFDPEVCFVLIFPAIGLGLAGYALCTGLKNISLLTNGEMASARCASKEITNMRVNRKTVYKVWFDFVDRTGAYQKTFMRTTEPESFEDGSFKTVLYDTARPSRSIILQSLNKITLNEQGQVNACDPGRALKALMPVIGAMAVVASCIYLRHLT
ncbi:MAG: hypothetical protein JF609_08425 [Verrucomicrobia bacterium]|nr:hypothetical protein [Verrucomicrobiota bacterium]